MDHDPLSDSMFWVGALFVFVPIIFATVLLAFWWHDKKRRERTPPIPGAPGGEGEGDPAGL